MNENPPVDQIPVQGSRLNLIFIVVIGLVLALGIVYADVVLRARHSYLEGEKYFEWHQNPSLKKAFFDRQFEERKAGLEKALARGRLTKAKFDEELESSEFDRDFRVNESSLKYAYQWYKDTFELFSPPESKWVKRARVKAPIALNQWKEELREKKIPFTDTMLE